jgi:hypothetical protein
MTTTAAHDEGTSGWIFQWSQIEKPVSGKYVIWKLQHNLVI